MQHFEVRPIGRVVVSDTGTFIALDEQYIPALLALDGFSHIDVLWWCDRFDTAEARGTLEVPKPYRNAPGVMGIFATRSPVRPNPIALTAVQVLSVDRARGVIEIAYIDADDKTPVLDIKPYTPSLDRVESPGVPAWCGHWPASLEASADFDWAGEFMF